MDVALEKYIINKINSVYEGDSKIVYSDYTSSIENPLNKENSFSIHEKKIQSLAIEIYKFLNGFISLTLTYIHFEIDKNFINPNKDRLFEGSFSWGGSPPPHPLHISRKTYLISI